MAVALSILGTLFGLLLMAGGIAVIVYSLRNQHKIQRSIESGFQQLSEHVTKAAVALDNNAGERHKKPVERIDVWIPPSEGCEICGAEAVVVCSGPGMRPVWLCGPCHEEDEDFS